MMWQELQKKLCDVSSTLPTPKAMSTIGVAISHLRSLGFARYRKIARMESILLGEDESNITNQTRYQH
ncbi:MAG: hypothetical protein GIKADHBN_01085 [Phycisphaerales bacterium]|nr:hypothetical protein [Phycisphaerales bacterium]